MPGAPTDSSPISSKTSATESPFAGVGARDKSIIPRGIPSCFDASLPINCPILVILNAIFLIVSQRVVKS